MRWTLAKSETWSLGTTSKGEPLHPLMLRKDQRLQPWPVGSEWSLYRCEDCDKHLYGDDLCFDSEGVPLCADHYNDLLEEAAFNRWDDQQQGVDDDDEKSDGE